MKNNYILSFIFLMISLLGYSQTSTEVFETESHGSTTFTDNGVVFNIKSNVGTFKVQANYPNTGWSGTANDNRYIDNTGGVVAGASFSIKTTSNLFKVNRFWIFLGGLYLNQNVSGTLTVTGKLSGVTKFSPIKTNGFTTSMANYNGYTLIDLTNLNGQNYSNIVIDELVLTIGGNFAYVGLDAFTWVKDSNTINPKVTLSNLINVSCNGENNGSLTISATGGKAPYSYAWSPTGGTSATATGLVAGTYTVTVTDADGVKGSGTYTITEPTAIAATTSSTNVDCNGGSNGTATVTATGGTGLYTYSWSPSGGTAATATGLAAGTYTCTITDAMGCSIIKSVTITGFQPINVTVTGNQTCENNVATLTATGADIYKWYTQATDVNPLYVGSTFVTPVLTNDTSYYVKGLKLDTAQSLETIFAAANNHRGNMIDVTAQKDLLIDSFDVSPQGNTTIEVYYKEGTYDGYAAIPSAWTKLGSVPVVHTGNPVNIKPGSITIPAGKTYAFYITSSNISVSLNYTDGTGNDVFADANMTINAGIGLEYPFTDGTNQVFNPRIFNGRIHYKLEACSGPMLPVVVDVTSTPAPTGDTEQSFNLNDTLAALVVNGQNIKWYATQADAQAHVNALANTTVIVNNATYYATQTVGQCESSTALAVKAYNATLAVGTSNKTKAIQLYPNPVRDILNLKTDEKITSVDVFGIDGKKLMNQGRVTTNNQLDVDNLTQGAYILQVTTETKTETIKFIKQ